MQGGQGPGRGIYVARRIVAALVILLLLALFAPRACQALFGSGEEPVAPETTVSDEDIASGLEDTTEQGSVTDGGETGTEDDTGETAANVEEADEAPDIVVEAVVAPTEVVVGPEAPFEEVGIGGDVSPSPPAPIIDDQQQAVPTIAFEPIAFQPSVPVQEPLSLETPIPVQEEPSSLEAPIPPQEPVPLQEPVFFEESVFLEEPMFLEEPVFFEEPAFFEDIPFEEPVASDFAATEDDDVASNAGDFAVPQAIISDASG